MIKFDEEKQINSVNGALALRPEIEAAVDKAYKSGCKKVCYLGIGGTYASALQTENHMKAQSSFPVFVENAAQYNFTGNKSMGNDTLVVFSSVSGNTQEVTDAVVKARKAGARILGFVDKGKDTPLGQLSDDLIVYPANEQLKLFMVADRLMQKNGDFEDYDEYYLQLDKSLARILVDVEKAADEFGSVFAAKHHNDPLHYFVAAGNQYGAAYSYAMCYWEEQHWLRTKSIHAAEFFHGMLEIVEKGTPVTLFMGEDAERPMAERVARFLPKVEADYTIIDSADYKTEGLDAKYRGYISHLITHAVTQRIDAHIEEINKHDMTIRRYYRVIEY